jgi:putative heme-binding domain-containing protein
MVADLGGLELQKVLLAYRNSQNPLIGRTLIAALEKSPALPSLTPEELRTTLKHFPADVQNGAQQIYTRLDRSLEGRRARIAELQPILGGGNADNGRTLFFSYQTGCSACHLVRGTGGRVGPDLSTIGAIRTAGDLLESVVFPSASFVAGYEPYIVKSKKGEILNGIIGRETADSIYLYGADRVEVRIRRTSVESLQRSRVSLMPEGLDAKMSRQELADLIAFLLSLK